MIDSILAGFLTFVLSWILTFITLIVGAYLYTKGDEYQEYMHYRSMMHKGEKENGG